MFQVSSTNTKAARDTSGSSASAPRQDVDARWLNEQIARGRKVGMFAVWTTLTPALAQHIIDHHMPAGSNRRLRGGHVAKLASSMAAGFWNGATHQGLAFAQTGILNDGQHRTHACVRSGASINVMMTFGQPRSAFEVIDQDGAQRDAATILELDGLKIGTASIGASLARGVLAIRAGGSSAAMREVRKGDILDFVRSNAEAVHRAVLDGQKIARGIRAKLSPSNLGAAIYLIRERVVGPAIEPFIDALALGAELRADSPVLLCREGLRAGTFGAELRNPSDRRPHEIAAVINAWNLWRMGRTTKKKTPLLWSPNTRFPRPLP